MTELTVFRVEDSEHRGPYRSQRFPTQHMQRVSNSLCTRHSEWIQWYAKDFAPETHPNIHPGPWEDPGMRDRWCRIEDSPRRITRYYRFGFASRQRLVEWFAGEYGTLATLRMHVAEYKVPHQAVIRGGWQLAFRHPSATLVQTHALASVLA